MDKNLLKNTKTRENLMKAFAGESMARMRYCMFASIAEKEGYIKVSEIFKKVSENEKEHAELYYRYLDGDDVRINDISYPSCNGNTLENLLCAVKYEEEEHITMYPEYARIAKEEGFEDISNTFSNIASIEKHHSETYKKIAELIEKNMMFNHNKEIEWECSHCGFVVLGEEAPKKCVVCGKTQGYYGRHCGCM